MRHYNITLERQDRSVRQWSLWANSLTIGSHPRSALVLPAPVAMHAAVFEHDGVLDLPMGRLLIHEDTPMRESLWVKARERMTLARKLEWKEPGTRDKRRSLALAALSLFGITGLAAMQFSFKHPPKVADVELPPFIFQVAEDAPPVPPPPPPEPQEPERALRQEDLKPQTNPNDQINGGSTETNTIAAKDLTPAAVMKHSVMDMLSTMSDGAIGEDVVDPNEKNLIDVILAGGGGHMQHGRGGQGAGGGDDRMAEVHGVGIGYHGIDGIAAGTVGGHKGPLHLSGGRPGTPVAIRGRVVAPAPDAISMGDESGTRSPESILRVIRSSIGGFQYTYQKYLRDKPDLGGKISLRFTIAPSGGIIAIEVLSSNTGDSKLDEDIKDKARRMAFDAIPKGNVTVTYAFVLDKQ